MPDDVILAATLFDSARQRFVGEWQQFLAAPGVTAELADAEYLATISALRAIIVIVEKAHGK